MFFIEKRNYGNGRILKEDATATMPVDETRKEISSKFNFKDWQFATRKPANGIELAILYPGIFRNSKHIIQAMSACGWTFSRKNYIVHNNMLWKAMSFDPMFQDDISSEAKGYKHLFHWTPLYNYANIMKEGLKPKSQNAVYKYPDRVHLMKGNIPANALFSLGRQLFARNQGKNNNGIPTDVNKYIQK